MGFSPFQVAPTGYSDLLCLLMPNIPLSFPPQIISYFSDLKFQGVPNQLSQDHVDWDIITDVSQATFKPKTEEKRYEVSETSYVCEESQLSA